MIGLLQSSLFYGRVPSVLTFQKLRTVKTLGDVGVYYTVAFFNTSLISALILAARLSATTLEVLSV